MEPIALGAVVQVLQFRTEDDVGFGGCGVDVHDVAAGLSPGGQGAQE